MHHKGQRAIIYNIELFQFGWREVFKKKIVIHVKVGKADLMVI